jgi:hypothetical protein
VGWRLVSLAAASSRSAPISLRTIYSALCRFLVAMILWSLPAHVVGRENSHKPTNESRSLVGTN